ncbi:MAG: DMT family transporter [Chloroflexota bacterium]|nr:MAG: DMT family transporter [Chloroflexota bacterium]
MILLGQLAALATAFCWSLTAVFFSYSGRLVGSGVVNRSRLLFAMLFISITHLILVGTIFTFGAETYRWGWLALSSILGLVLGDTFLFRAYVLVGPRLSMLMMSTVPILSAVMAWVFLAEQLTGVELIGIMVTVSGIAWVVTERRTEQVAVENKNYSLGLFFAFLGALGQAANLIAAKFALDGDFPSISATSIRLLVALVILWLVAAFRGEIRYTFGKWRNRPALKATIAGSIVGPFLGIWFSLMAVQLAPVGIAATLMALPPVILIPLGYFLYGERVSRRGVTGTVVAFCGVAVILLPL